MDPWGAGHRHGRDEEFDLVQGFLQNFPVFAIESLQLDFDAGWNIFSSWVKPVDGDLKLLFSPLIWDYSLIKVQDEAWNTLEDLGNLGGWKISSAICLSPRGIRSE